jgi:predicted lysophospholipase L1 biosynthesis ABC-type transport system permease subunit
MTGFIGIAVVVIFAILGLGFPFLWLAILIGILPAAIAHRKGGSFFGWWGFGAALFIVALPAAIIKRDEDREMMREFLRNQVKNQGTE